MILNDAMLDPTHHPTLAAQSTATMPNPEKDVDPDKRFASPREDAMLLAHADRPSLNATVTHVESRKFAMERETVSRNPPAFKPSSPLFFLK
jgi:hypothetical protein